MKTPIGDLRPVVVALAAITLTIGTAVLLLGWGLDIRLVRRVHPSFASMVPSTALALSLCGAALLRGGRSLVLAASIVAAIGVVDLIAIGLTDANGIDMLLLPGTEAFQTASMAIATATLFLLAALCLFALTRRRAGMDRAFVTAATLGLVLSLTAIVGYVFDAEALYEVSLFTAMALHTAVAFACLFGAALASRPEIGWMSILLQHGGGSRAARRLVPAAVVFPFVLLYLALAATQAGFFNASFRASVVAIVMMVVLSAAALRFAAIQNGIEADLRATLRQRDLLLKEVRHRVKNNMQMTTSLLRMGESETDDPQLQTVLETTVSRVEALGVVHQLLMDTEVPSDVAASRFLKELADNVTTELAAGGRDVVVEASDRLIYIDTAVTLSLLVNELLIGAVLQADPSDNGTVRVVFGEQDENVRLSVIDDGHGLRRALGPSATSNVGTTIIQGLVRQLRGELSFEEAASGGTVAHVVLPTARLEEGRYE